MSERQYDIVLFGATGYTGKYTAENIVRLLPTNLRWAVAGRSFSKLQSLVDELKKSHPDRVLPGIETSTLELGELRSLAKRTKVLINCVGPYCLYGTNVVQACAEEGTHYTDTTGEVPWVKKMIERFEGTAKRTGAILIPIAGFESAVPDILAYATAAHIRRTRKVGTRSLTTFLWKIESNASGGTLATVLSISSAFSVRELSAAFAPYSISPSAPTPAALQKPSLLRRLSNSLFGVRLVPGLGLGTTSITGSTNAAIVQRSWGLRPDVYGARFRYEELLAVRSRLAGVLMHWALGLGALAVAFPPIRWLIRRFIYQPGEGPTKEQAQRDYVELRCVAEPDDGGMVKGKFVFRGGMYDLSGLLMTEIARGLLEGSLDVVKQGGFATAAAQGDALLERVTKAGIEIDVEG